MHNLSLIGLLVLFWGLFSGVCEAVPHVLSYDDYDENFIIRLEADVSYTIKRGNESFPCFVRLTAGPSGKRELRWQDKTCDLTGMLRPEGRLVYLVHSGAQDYIYLYAPSGEISYYGLREKWISGIDHALFKFLEEPSDPQHLVITRQIDVVGFALARVEAYVNEQGVVKEYPSEGKYYYCLPEFRHKMELEDDVRVLVLPSEESSDDEAEATQVPKGTRFTRLRALKNAYVTDVLLEDGRVMRFDEQYWFSEPSAYQALLDLDRKQFHVKLLTE